MKSHSSNGSGAKDTLRTLATDLHEVYSLLNELSSNLEGGGIVTARDIEPAVSRAVPRLRNAVAMLYAASQNDDYGELAPGSERINQNPLLI